MRKLTKHFTVATIVVVSALAATVCTTALPLSAMTNAAPGYQVMTVKKAGFSIAIPGEWIAFDPTKAESDAHFDALVAANPKLKEFRDAAAEDAEHSVLTAVGTSAGGSGVVSFGVTFYAGVSVVEPASYVKGSLERSGAFDRVEVQRVEVAGKDAVRARCSMVLDATEPDAGQGALTVYELVGPKGVLVVGFASRGGALSTATVHTVMKSLQLRRG